MRVQATPAALWNGWYIIYRKLRSAIAQQGTDASTEHKRQDDEVRQAAARYQIGERINLKDGKTGRIENIRMDVPARKVMLDVLVDGKLVEHEVKTITA